MDFQLYCEGFPTDEDLKERLLMCGRKFLMANASRYFVRITIKQIDGFVQSRVDINLESRKLSAFVRRKDPVKAMEAAILAMEEALESQLVFEATGTED
jgi:hypothetical protein